MSSEIDRLRRALVLFGAHRPGCPSVFEEGGKSAPCDCGLAAAYRGDAELGDTPPPADARIRQLEDQVAEERARTNAAELQLVAARRELVLATEAARALAHSYIRDERPPQNLLSYALSLKEAPPLVEPEPEPTRRRRSA